MGYRRNPADTRELREQARERLRRQGVDGARILSRQETQQLLEDLKIHQIELENQNESLNATRAQLEAALNESSELYDFSPLGSVSLDGAATMTRLNLAAARLLGGERAHLVGTKMGQHVIDADRTAFNALIERARSAGALQSAELVLKNGDLAIQHVNVRVSPDPAGQGWQVALVDISDRIRHGRELRATEERWRLALEAAGDGVWDWNVQSGEVVYSKGYAELLGFAEQALGDRVEDWRQSLHPDDRARVLGELDACLRGAVERYWSEQQLRCKDGSWKWVLARGAIVERAPDGRPLRMIGTLVDISSRKSDERALLDAARFQQAIFDSLDAPLVVLDRDGVILQANAAWRRHAANSDNAAIDNWSGRPYLEMLARIIANEPRTMQAAASGLASVLSGAAPSFKLEAPFFVAAQRAWLSMKVMAVRDVDKRIVVSHEDVGDIKAAQLASLQLANTDALTGAQATEPPAAPA